MTDPTVADLRNELREHADVPVPDPPIAALLARADEIKRTRSRWALIAVAAGIAAVIGLGFVIAGRPGTDDRVVPAGEPTSTNTQVRCDVITGDCKTTGPYDGAGANGDEFTVDLVPQSSAVTDADLGLVTDLVSIARTGVYDDPQLEAMKTLVQNYPFAEHVQLGNGLVLRDLARSRLVLPKTWESDAAGFAGRDGVLSVLDQINLFISLSSESTSTGPMKVFVADHPRCGGAAPLRFPEADGLRRISFEPAHTQSCLNWFSISLYQDDQGKVAAVTLDLVEP